MIDTLSLVNAKVTVTRPTDTLDSAGSPIRSYVAVASHVACYISWDSGLEGAIAGGQRDQNAGKAIFQYGAGIQQEDRLTVLVGPCAGKILRVDATRDVYENPDLISHIEVEWSEVNQ